MKNEKFFITPDMIPRIDVDLENIDFERLSSKEFQKEFKQSKAYEKYVMPALKREKARKKQQRKDWWKENVIQLLGILLAFIAIIPLIIQAIVYILSKLV